MNYSLMFFFFLVFYLERLVYLLSKFRQLPIILKDEELKKLIEERRKEIEND